MSYLKSLARLEKCRDDAEYTVRQIYNIIDPHVFTDRIRMQVNTHARFAVWYILNKREKFSTKAIGKIYGYDHSTIINGIRRAIDTGIPYELGMGQPVDNSLITSAQHGNKSANSRHGHEVIPSNPQPPVDNKG